MTFLLWCAAAGLQPTAYSQSIEDATSMYWTIADWSAISTATGDAGRRRCHASADGRQRRGTRSRRHQPRPAGISITTLIGSVGMKSPIVKHSIVIKGRRTTIGIEEEFWAALKEIAQERGVTLTRLVSTIDAERNNANLASALRLFALDHYRTLAKQVMQGANWPLIG
jgi:predicted DNA-binding ribbon-helix-helix protein